MKKVAAITLTFAITIGLNFSCGDTVAPENDIPFEDPNFEALIREVLEKPEGEITAEDMLSITTLSGVLRDITNISGIEYCVNLTELSLFTNNLGIDFLSDLTPLSGLINLRWLFLNSNQISDINSLSGLINLTTLDLDTNQISDIVPLAGLMELRELKLESNQIVDIKPLVDNTGFGEGDYIYLNNNPLSDTSITVYILQLRAKGVNVDWD